MSATMAAVAGLLTGRLSPTWQALTALGGAFAVGAAITLSAMSFRQLPAQVRAIDERLTEVEMVAARVDRQYTRIVCLLTLPDSVSPMQAERSCP